MRCCGKSTGQQSLALVSLTHSLALQTFFAYKMDPPLGEVQDSPILRDSTFYKGNFYFCPAQSFSNQNSISWSTDRFFFNVSSTYDVLAFPHLQMAPHGESIHVDQYSGGVPVVSG